MFATFDAPRGACNAHHVGHVLGVNERVVGGDHLDLVGVLQRQAVDQAPDAAVTCGPAGVGREGRAKGGGGKITESANACRGLGASRAARRALRQSRSGGSSGCPFGSSGSPGSLLRAVLPLMPILTLAAMTITELPREARWARLVGRVRPGAPEREARAAMLRNVRSVGTTGAVRQGGRAKGVGLRVVSRHWYSEWRFARRLLTSPQTAAFRFHGGPVDSLR